MTPRQATPPGRPGRIRLPGSKRSATADDAEATCS